MIDKIDWKKPLQCSAGEVELISFNAIEARVAVVPEKSIRDDRNSMIFWVALQTGAPVSSLVNAGCFTISNVKSNRDKAIEIGDKVASEYTFSPNKLARELVEAFIKEGLISE